MFGRKCWISEFKAAKNPAIRWGKKVEKKKKYHLFTQARKMLEYAAFLEKALKNYVSFEKSLNFTFFCKT